MWIKSDFREAVEVCDSNPAVVWAVVLVVHRSIPISVVFAFIADEVICGKKESKSCIRAEIFIKKKEEKNCTHSCYLPGQG